MDPLGINYSTECSYKERFHSSRMRFFSPIHFVSIRIRFFGVERDLGLLYPTRALTRGFRFSITPLALTNSPNILQAFRKSRILTSSPKKSKKHQNRHFYLRFRRRERQARQTPARKFSTYYADERHFKNAHR